MAKRVLGDDPFAAQPPEPKKSSIPPKKKPTRSTRPPPRKSVAPPAKAAAPAPAPVTEPETTPVAPAASAAPVPPPEVVPAATSSVPPESPYVPDDGIFAEADLPPEMSGESDAEPQPSAAQGAPSSPPLESSIQEIEARLDQLLRAAQEVPHARDALDRMSERLRQATGSSSASSAPTDDGTDALREIASSGYYLRQWGRVALRDRSEEVDDFGLDPKYAERWYPLFDFLYERWWRVEVEGIEHVPATGRVALVANHSGAVPYDGVMLATALRKEHPTRRQLRWLAEDFIFHFPFLGAYTNRIGAVRACQENAERLLKGEHCVGMFPEGLKGVSKLFRDRYKLQRFGRGGHVKLALRTRTPIVPVTIVGAEETHPNLFSSDLAAKVLGLPFLPITPTFPWLGPLGLIPAPSKWKILFGEPIAMEGYSPDAADDEVLVGRLNEKLRATIQDTLSRALATRASVFRG